MWQVWAKAASLALGNAVSHALHTSLWWLCESSTQFLLSCPQINPHIPWVKHWRSSFFLFQVKHSDNCELQFALMTLEGDNYNWSLDDSDRVRHLPDVPSYRLTLLTKFYLDRSPDAPVWIIMQQLICLNWGNTCTKCKVVREQLGSLLSAITEQEASTMSGAQTRCLFKGPSRCNLRESSNHMWTSPHRRGIPNHCFGTVCGNESLCVESHSSLEPAGPWAEQSAFNKHSAVLHQPVQISLPLPLKALVLKMFRPEVWPDFERFIPHNTQRIMCYGLNIKATTCLQFHLTLKGN